MHLMGYSLLEGMTIAGYATGATNGFVFIRHGHDGPIDRTEEAIEQAYKAGLLGKNILGSDFNFDVEVDWDVDVDVDFDVDHDNDVDIDDYAEAKPTASDKYR